MRVKTFISVIIILLLKCASLASAQGAGYYKKNAVIRATATVIDQIDLITIRDVNLNEPKTVDGQLLVSPISSPYAGLMRITGQPGRNVRITYLTSESIIEEGGSGGVVKARYQISGFETDNQAASRLLDVGEAVVRLSSTGTFYLWLGASLDLTGATPGGYISEFLIEMEGN